MAENIKTTVEELRKLINVDNVIGSPIETEDKILIPVMRMGVGFGAGESLLGNEGNDVAGAAAGVEPISMVMIPKKGNDAEGVRVLDLSKGTETNKALSDLGLIITDLVKSYMGTMDNSEYVNEEEFIEPEFTTYDNEEEAEKKEE
ncbi:MAG: sporulation protein [Methanobrevibacter sp.]|uniref:GerW family sporulation protein n=1 Tax=Methanobrevibacter sp. TaxID=66852 RepID=UPI001B0DE77C|nr:spore germination protein GerW family protein [Methanobrevibacter sp.]MBO5152002.1 sporulation protein [Methanobrevibacter sp.]